VVTLFHKPSLAASMRAVALLKQVSATASETATEDQASDHSHQNEVQRSEFELNIEENPPTDDQLRTILEYAGSAQAKDIVQGASGLSDALRIVKEDKQKFKYPLVSLSCLK